MASSTILRIVVTLSSCFYWLRAGMPRDIAMTVPDFRRKACGDAGFIGWTIAQRIKLEQWMQAVS
jgi:hypothetical protein